MMEAKHAVTGVVAAIVLLASVAAHAETASESYAKGEKLLAKGDFETALRSFAAAALAERGNSEYAQRYAMLRRVVELRSRLSTETKQEQWEYIAKALRAFYVNERIYPVLLELDEIVHKKMNSPESAAMLAETQLAMEQNRAAVATLSVLEPTKTTTMTQLLLGIAMARNGEADQAKQVAAKIDLPKDASPAVTYTAARLQAAIGDSTKAMELLTSCFETTLPSQLDGFKTHAKTCPEFVAIASTPEFVSVLKTESKMPESKCSGGSSCAGCPMKGKCSKNQGKP